MGIVFWTKDGRPLIRHVPELRNRGYAMYFLYTVNNFPHFLEPHAPSLRQTLETIEDLATLFDKRVIRWRYDPVVLTPDFGLEKCLENFSHVCSMLKNFTDECLFSFCDYYKKTRKKMSQRGIEYLEPQKNEAIRMALEMSDISESHGIGLKSCAHDFLVQGSIRKACCVDTGFLLNLVDSAEAATELKKLKPAGNRPECGCAESVDVGAYNTCYFDCVYCYATTTPRINRDEFTSYIRGHECLDPRCKLLTTDEIIDQSPKTASDR